MVDRYGSMAFLSFVFGYLFLPELKNRSLEEVDSMFESALALRKFGEYQSLDNTGALISKLERGDEEDGGLGKDGGHTIVESGDVGRSK